MKGIIAGGKKQKYMCLKMPDESRDKNICVETRDQAPSTDVDTRKKVQKGGVAVGLGEKQVMLKRPENRS